VILLPGMPLARAAEVCERLRERVAGHDWARCGVAARLPITVSIGLASAPPLELRALLQAADQALYRAKDSGRNRLVLEPEDTRTAG
jgi:diguanylate cyclase (GGDEF)-like protein